MARKIKTEAHYQNLLTISEVLIWSIDSVGTITQINAASWSILGLSADEIVGKPLISLVPIEEQDRFNDALTRLLDGDSWNNFTIPFISVDGKQVNLNINSIPHQDKKGVVIGATGTANNITEQVHSMEVLRLKEHRYRQMFEQNQAIKLIIDCSNGNIIEANSAALSYYGYEEEQLIGMNINTLFKMPDGAQETPLKRLVVEQHPFQLLKQQLASGEIRDAEIQAGPINIKDQQLLYLVIQDVTEKLSAERALHDNEEKLRGIVEAASEGIIMIGPAGKIQFYNPAAQSIFGYPSEFILGEPFVDLLDAKFLHQNDISPQSDINSWLPSMAGGICELIGRRMNGEHFPLRLSLSTVEINKCGHYVALIQDRSESQKNADRLTYLAQHDVLTGLLNRREFEQRLDLRLVTPISDDETLALCYIDIDKFGLINNTCGQAAGNDLLLQISTLIQTELHEAEFIGRLGGDEFALLLGNCSYELAEQRCKKLLQTIKNFQFTWEGQSFDITICIGMTAFNPTNESISSLLSTTHIACNKAKEKGHNQLHIYHTGDIDLIKQYGNMRLISKINQALNEGRFKLFAQPIMALQNTPSHRHHHYEILVEMRDEKGRPVSPNKFIKTAEQFILMPAIDRWVVNHLFVHQADNLRRWAEQNHDEKGFLFAINLSGTSLADEALPNFLIKQFTQHKIPYSSICFEITETAAVTNMKQAMKLIKQLRKLGCRFALDDFGTGLSSYTYLKDMPIDYLKIDGSFVKNITADSVDQAMVNSINQVGHALGLRTIAEWAEDQAAIDQLTKLGVDFAQGYGVGKPQPVEEIAYL
ncbi:MAG: EAL domain-containing protein [Candidatus Polarisedimenticolaceae bacterium]|nr:EAL domain-containing protein [Candidatus Polarisedimenticolaceae bacterium]